MPTKKPRVTLAISEDDLERVKDYQKNSNAKSMSNAIIQLIRIGVDSEDVSENISLVQRKSQLLDESEDLNKQFDKLLESLDERGKAALAYFLEKIAEKARVYINGE